MGKLLDLWMKAKISLDDTSRGVVIVLIKEDVTYKDILDIIDDLSRNKDKNDLRIYVDDENPFRENIIDYLYQCDAHPHDDVLGNEYYLLYGNW